MAKPERKPATSGFGHAIAADLIVVLVAVTDEEPRVMTIERGSALGSDSLLMKLRSRFILDSQRNQRHAISPRIKIDPAWVIG
jgi:hypothetical protein